MIGCLGLSYASKLMTLGIFLLTNLMISVILSIFAMWDYNRINKRKVEACRLYRITDEHKDRFRNMGDESPLFRYTL